MTEKLQKNIIVLILLLNISCCSAQVFSAKQYPQGYFAWPVVAAKALAANFGELRPNHYHMGLDCKTDKKQNLQVLAAADGVVRTAGSHKSYGNYVRILHADGDETLYAHMQYLFVRAGERVTAGQTLGTVGQTGNATGPHLHFEILHKGLRYDPAQALQDAA